MRFWSLKDITIYSLSFNLFRNKLLLSIKHLLLADDCCSFSSVLIFFSFGSIYITSFSFRIPFYGEEKTSYKKLTIFEVHGKCKNEFMTENNMLKKLF